MQFKMRFERDKKVRRVIDRAFLAAFRRPSAYVNPYQLVTPRDYFIGGESDIQPRRVTPFEIALVVILDYRVHYSPFQL